MRTLPYSIKSVPALFFWVQQQSNIIILEKKKHALLVMDNAYFYHCIAFLTRLYLDLFSLMQANYSMALKILISIFVHNKPVDIDV